MATQLGCDPEHRLTVAARDDEVFALGLLAVNLA